MEYFSPQYILLNQKIVFETDGTLFSINLSTSRTPSQGILS